jgi:uncharacterized protein with HEPN domain
MSRDNAYLADILRARQSIQRFVGGITKAEFLSNEEKYEAVNRKFEIIGEAARHLSPAARQQLPGMPWELIIGMRNILIHDYDDIDLNVVWDTITDDLPSLILKVQAYLAAHPPEGPPTA